MERGPEEITDLWLANLEARTARQGKAVVGLAVGLVMVLLLIAVVATRRRGGADDGLR